MNKELPEWVRGRIGSNGTIEWGNWQSIRDALRAAYEVLELERKGDIPLVEWQIAGLVLDFHKHTFTPECSECRKPITTEEPIKCFDCGCHLHKGCAERHFWPNGRNTRYCETLAEIKLKREIAELRASITEG